MEKQLFPLVCAAAFFCFLACTGCRCAWTDAGWEPRIGPQIVYQEACVERSSGPVPIMPEASPPRPLSAVCMPFEIEQAMDNRHFAGRELGRLVWKNWVGMRVFPRFVFMEEMSGYALSNALTLAREQKVDLLVRGRVPYYMNGGVQGATSIAVVLEIFDVQSGEVVWSLEHAGRVEHFLDQDYIVFTRRSRMPESPVWTVANVLAADMGRPVKAWNYGHDWKNNLAPLY